MTVAKHGVSATSQDKILVDAGAVYMGFKTVDNPGTLLGATRGGNTFELTRTIRRMEADGARGPVKGMRRVEEVVATIKANMMELTAENLRLAIADAIYKSGISTVGEWETVGTGNGTQKVFQLGFLIDDCETIWDEGTPEDVVESLDSVDYVCGAKSAKFVVGDGAIADQVLGSIDISGGSELPYLTLKTYEFLGLRVKSSIALKAGQLQILLDKDGACVSPEATIDLPAIPADTWTTVMVPADFSSLTADIASVGIKQVPDLGAFTLNIDQIKAVHGMVETNSEEIEVDSSGVDRMTDYTMDYEKGAIQFVAGSIPGAVAVTASYKHRTISTDAVISGETTGANLAIIKDTAYLDSVAIVGTITKYDGTTKPIIIKILNALCDTAFGLALAPKDEAVPEVTFTAHYANDALDTEPWEITYPAA